MASAAKADLAVERFEADYHAHQRRVTLTALGGWVLFLLLVLVAAWISEISVGRLAEGIGRLGEFFGQMLPQIDGEHLLADKKTAGSLAYWFYDLPDWLQLIGQTIEIAILSTFLGTVLAFLLSFPAARNLGVPASVTFATRRFLEFCRTLPELVVAMIFVAAFGVGPLAGVLAIVIHTVGALGKLFSEVIENIDPKPLEGVRAGGGSWTEIVRYGVVPQVLPSFTSYSLIRFEANVGASAAIGIVGAGGIGMELRSLIDYTDYPSAFAIILMIIALIFVIDFVSERIRHRLIGVETAP